MPPVLNISNWNIDRSGVRGKWRIEHQVKLLESLSADVHILTEVHHDLTVDGKHAVALSSPGQSPYLPTDRAAGIWTSLPVLRVHAVRTPVLSTCAELETPLGPALIYATIFPYRDAQVNQGYGRWQHHRETLALQIADWVDMRRSMPDHHMVIGGDFNMTMGSSNTYVDRDSRSKLMDACKRHGFRCITDADFRSVVGRANIDHLLISPLLDTESPVRA